MMLFCFPHIQKSLDALSEAYWFSTMDLVSLYTQVRGMEETKTAFYTPFGLFKWNLMSFGLCNSPSTFQQLMEWMFGDQQWHCVVS